MSVEGLKALRDKIAAKKLMMPGCNQCWQFLIPFEIWAEAISALISEKSELEKQDVRREP